MNRRLNKSIQLFLATILFILIMGFTSKTFAATTTVNALWEKCRINGTNYDVYCVQPNKKLSEGTYTVGDKYEVTGNVVKKNGTIITAGTDEYKYALKMAYILATPDTAMSKSMINARINNWKSSLSNDQRRAIYTGIYDLTSIRQTAIWMSFSGSTNGKWSDSTGTVLKYNWYLGAPGESYGDNHFTIVKNSDGTYSYTSAYGGYTNGVYEGIDSMKFPNQSGNSAGYYEAAKDLKNKASAYTGVTSNIENITVGKLEPDYSNNSYVEVGPIKLKHNSNITLSNTIKVYDKNGNQINNVTMVKNATSYGTEIYIRIAKSDSMPLTVGKVKIEYSAPNSASSTWYKLYKNNSQNLVAGNGSFGSSGDEYEFDVDVQLVPPIQIELNKLDTQGNKINGPKFKVVYSNGLTTETKTVTNGSIIFSERRPTNLNSFTATITEMSTNSGYKLLSDSIVLQFKYNSGKWDITEISGPEENVTINTSITSGLSKITMNVENKSLIKELTILKLDAQSNSTKVEGAKFKVTLTNIESIEQYSSTGQSGKIILNNVTTNSNGNIVLENLVIADLNNNITIEIEETEAPKGYKKIDGKITVTLKRSGDSYTIHTASKDSTVLDSEFMAGNVTVSANHEIALNIKNMPIMNIGGIVWEDEQTGIKDVQGPDGLYKSTDKPMSGIKVFLTDGEPAFNNGELTNAIAQTTTANGGEQVKYIGHKGEVTTTLQKGEYLFAGIERKDNYYIVFKYDGINYETVGKGTANNASKADEIGRIEFNKKFQTITTNTAIAEDGASLGLSYNSSNNQSKLITKDGENIKPEFVMYSKSEKVDISEWQKTWTDEGKVNKEDSRLNINCGLTYRFFDLAIGMDVDTAKLKINGKETTYSYNQILDGKLEDIKFEDISKDAKDENGNDIIYNLYLYYSDYYYRISDYITASISNNVTDENDSEIIHNNMTDVNDELKAFVTYKVIIKNQSTINSAKVNKLAYYYDMNYKLDSITDDSGNDIMSSIEITSPVIKNINGTNKNYVEINLKDKSNKLEASDYRQEIYLTFEVKKSEDGTRSLPKDVECANVVEILSYSTAEGLIDNDSAPGNLQTFGYEDDTDEAKGINIKIKQTQREVSGIVWDDGAKNEANGKIDTDENRINDVIVQLIEVKAIQDASGNTKYYEYIWQETRSGSNKVKKLSEDGTGVQEYSYDDSITIENGEYLFKDFIPGNYIVRYIYGDGTIYDVTDNVQKYNGQDYQSTKDPNYKANWYNTAGYTQGASVARDNEARRLEVMAYSTMIDNTKGNALEMKTDEMLQNTWMVADTSRINVPVDTDNKATEDNKTSVSFETIVNSVVFDNMNFGLALRPQTKLILEKHITGLKITPNGTGVQSIVEARAEIESILNSTDITVNTEGVTAGLTAIKSERDNRGFWKVETDIEELAQGATLEVEYTYVIKNESEEDYLSNGLVDLYKDNIEIDVDNDGVNDYSGKVLPDLKRTVKTTMRSGTYAYIDSKIGTYLGEFYYTGNKGSDDALVSSRAEMLKESLNEQLGKQENVGDDFEVRDAVPEDLNEYIDVNGSLVSDGKNILTILNSKNPSEFLVRKTGEDYTVNDTDYTKTIKVTTVLSSLTEGEIGGSYPSYIAEITRYSNAAGRRNMEAEPENLSYVHSEDNEMTMNSVTYELAGETHEARNIEEVPGGATVIRQSNEEDEFWGESIIISKPTGEDKLTGIQIAVILTISVAILGVGIVLIKKFVLKK